MKVAIRNRRLFGTAHREWWQTWAIVITIVGFIVLGVVSLLHETPTIQFIEVGWMAVATYGLIFDSLNVLNVRHDQAEAQSLETNGFSGIYWESQLTYAKKRSICLITMFVIGAGSMFLHPSAPDSESASNLFAFFFFVIGYCIASNAQDAWLYRRKLAEQLRAPLYRHEPEAVVASEVDTSRATREEEA